MKTLKQLTVLILFLSGLMTTGCDREENAAQLHKSVAI